MTIQSEVAASTRGSVRPVRFAKRIRLGLAAALVAALGAGIAVAVAHVVSYETAADITSTTSGSTGAMGGTVYSDDTDECSARRLMTVYRRRSGPDKQVGEERTNGAGRALITFPDGLPQAKYYATVARKRLKPKGSDQHKHVCSDARTDTDTFSFPPAP
jgi:hypothetical protein